MTIDAQRADFSALRPATPLTLTLPGAQLPDTFQSPRLPDGPQFSTTEFRARAPTLFDPLPRSDVAYEAPMLRGTTVWQRLREYRTRDRVRLLTLWESGTGSVSLQTSKRGDPSLQWTSRLMNRGGATRGLLDHLFAVSIAGASSSLRAGSHGTVSRPSEQPGKLLDTRIRDK